MSRHVIAAEPLTFVAILAVGLAACTGGDEPVVDAGDAAMLDGAGANADASSGKDSLDGNNPDALSGLDATTMPLLAGTWRAGPCNDAAPCVVAGFDPIVDLGPGVESCLADDSGGLIMIGRFHRTNGIAARKIARWNGRGWMPLGDGLERFGEALAVHAGRIYAAGAFRRTGVDGTALSYVGQFDGESWSPLGTGFEGEGDREGYGRALVVWNGQLIAGGNFVRAGGKPAQHVALWDGKAWQPLGEGINGPVHTFAVHEGRLIAAGKFSRAGLVDAANIAAWDGVKWHALGTGIDDQAFGLAVHAGDLFVTGDFTRAGARDARHVARWDGSAWHALSTGLNGPDKPFGRALVSFEGHLIVGGNFTDAGGIAARRVAAWDGQRFSAVGAGLGNWIEGLTVYNRRLVACGWFNHAAEGGPLGFGFFDP
ncbi:MAG: hypothetical protein SF187_22440 [Deltaproteobacteria bacterium]|nr:hypothetical protein [Deltaproteobacteria bacterium]